MTTQMEPWRHAFRYGVAMAMSDAALEALRNALVTDSPLLIQGTTLERDAATGDVCGACAITLAVWQSGECPAQVIELMDRFSAITETACQLTSFDLVSQFLAWVDNTPRQMMRAHLLGEVNLALARRLAVGPVAAPITTRALHEAI